MFPSCFVSSLYIPNTGPWTDTCFTNMGQKKKIGCHFGGKNNNMIGDWQFIPQNTPTCGCLLGATCKHDGRVHISSSSLPLFHFKNVSSAEQHDTLNCGWSQGSVFMHVKWHLATALLSAVASKRWLSPTSFFSCCLATLLISLARYLWWILTWTETHPQTIEDTKGETLFWFPRFVSGLAHGPYC